MIFSTIAPSRMLYLYNDYLVEVNNCIMLPFGVTAEHTRVLVVVHAPKGSSLIRVHIVCFHDKISLKCISIYTSRVMCIQHFREKNIVKPPVAATSIKHGPPLSEHFRVPPPPLTISNANAPLLSVHLSNAASGRLNWPQIADNLSFSSH